MKKNMLGLLIIPSIAWSAAEGTLFKRVTTDVGTLSIKGSYDPASCAFAIQSWSRPTYTTSGAIAVVVGGKNIQSRVAGAIAARFPRAIELLSSKRMEKKPEAALRDIIDEVNEESASLLRTVSYPFGTKVSSIAVLIACSDAEKGVDRKVIYGTACNDLEEAALIPQPKLRAIEYEDRSAPLERTVLGRLTLCWDDMLRFEESA